MINELLDPEEFRLLQVALLLRPEQDPVIPGSGGLRKVRWSLPGRGKRGGARVIYFWHEESETYFLLYAFRKNAQENLTAQQLRVLASLVRQELR